MENTINTYRIFLRILFEDIHLKDNKAEGKAEKEADDHAKKAALLSVGLRFYTLLTS
jgi:hypothetical protein